MHLVCRISQYLRPVDVARRGVLVVAAAALLQAILNAGLQRPIVEYSSLLWPVPVFIELHFDIHYLSLILFDNAH